jgi:hypothetical protein
MAPKYKSVKVRYEDYELLKKHADKVGRKLLQVLTRAIRSYCA